VERLAGWADFLMIGDLAFGVEAFLKSLGKT
jgi:hypothetical protein